MPLTFPQFPANPILISLFEDVSKETLTTIKTQLVAANSDYDYCFLNTNHIISTEHLHHSIYKSVLNFHNGAMRAKTLNTEIIFNLSPINNIMDALKRFGVDTECLNVIVIKVFKANDLDKTVEETRDHWHTLLGVDGSGINDTVLESLVNVQKVKKVYKLNDAKLDGSLSQLTRLAIAACIIRGN